jgi:hypothetical protein
MAKGTELAPKNDAGQLAELDALQALFRENAGAGLDNIRPEDIILPRLSILQPTSPLVTEDGYQVGDIVNSITNENYGKRFEFYVLHYYPNRVKWESDDPGSPIECSSDNNITGSKFGKCAECPFSKWSKNAQGQDERPACTEFKNIIVLPANEGDDMDTSPIVFSGKRSALKPVNTLLSALAVSRKPAYASRWVLTVEKNQKDRQTWYTPKFTKGDDIKTVAEFMALKGNSDAMVAAQSRIRFQQEDESPAGAAATDEETGF